MDAQRDGEGPDVSDYFAPVLVLADQRDGARSPDAAGNRVRVKKQVPDALCRSREIVRLSELHRNFLPRGKRRR